MLEAGRRGGPGMHQTPTHTVACGQEEEEGGHRHSSTTHKQRLRALLRPTRGHASSTSPGPPPTPTTTAPQSPQKVPAGDPGERGGEGNARGGPPECGWRSSIRWRLLPHACAHMRFVPSCPKTQGTPPRVRLFLSHAHVSSLPFSHKHNPLTPQPQTNLKEGHVVHFPWGPLAAARPAPPVLDAAAGPCACPCVVVPAAAPRRATTTTNHTDTAQAQQGPPLGG